MRGRRSRPPGIRVAGLLFACLATTTLPAWRLRTGEQAGPPPVGEREGPGDVYANIPPVDDRGRDQLAMFRAWNPDPIGNHERNLASVRPELAAVVRRALADDPGLRFVVGSGLRSTGEQALAERWGWSPARGRSAIGAAMRKHIDGEAVDLWPLDQQNRVTFSPEAQQRVAAAVLRAGRELGIALSWGGHWRHRKDPTHIELVR